MYWMFCDITFFYDGLRVSVCLRDRKMAECETESHLNPIKILHTVEDVMSDDSIIVADGGDFVGTAAYILRQVSGASTFKLRTCTMHMYMYL